MEQKATAQVRSLNPAIVSRVGFAEKNRRLAGRACNIVLGAKELLQLVHRCAQQLGTRA